MFRTLLLVCSKPITTPLRHSRNRGDSTSHERQPWSAHKMTRQMNVEPESRTERANQSDLL